jgi:hypothetical protein
VKKLAPGISTQLIELPLFSKSSDGTTDFGNRYNPLTGGLPAQLRLLPVHAFLSNHARVQIQKMMHHAGCCTKQCHHLVTTE